jgi:hypothetical protein
MAPGWQTLYDGTHGMLQQPSTATIGKGSAMEFTQELRTLTKFTAGPLPVISAYLHTRWRDQYQHAHAVTFFERHLYQTLVLEPETVAARESLSRDLERLRQ